MIQSNQSQPADSQIKIYHHLYLSEISKSRFSPILVKKTKSSLVAYSSYLLTIFFIIRQFINHHFPRIIKFHSEFHTDTMLHATRRQTLANLCGEALCWTNMYKLNWAVRMMQPHWVTEFFGSGIKTTVDKTKQKNILRWRFSLSFCYLCHSGAYETCFRTLQVHSGKGLHVKISPS